VTDLLWKVPNHTNKTQQFKINTELEIVTNKIIIWSWDSFEIINSRCRAWRIVVYCWWPFSCHPSVFVSRVDVAVTSSSPFVWQFWAGFLGWFTLVGLPVRGVRGEWSSSNKLNLHFPPKIRERRLWADVDIHHIITTVHLYLSKSQPVYRPRFTVKSVVRSKQIIKLIRSMCDETRMKLNETNPIFMMLTLFVFGDISIFQHFFTEWERVSPFPHPSIPFNSNDN